MGPPISQMSPLGLGEAQIVHRRELGVLDASLPTLEIIEVDLGNLDAAMAHDAGKAALPRPALQPAPCKGMTKPVGRDPQHFEASSICHTTQ
jgi:hypothetical protein